MKMITAYPVSAPMIPLHRRFKPKQFLSDLLFLMSLMSVVCAGVAWINKKALNLPLLILRQVMAEELAALPPTPK
jgi:hypothetical protein